MHQLWVVLCTLTAQVIWFFEVDFFIVLRQVDQSKDLLHLQGWFLLCGFHWVSFSSVERLFFLLKDHNDDEFAALVCFVLILKMSVSLPTF